MQGGHLLGGCTGSPESPNLPAPESPNLPAPPATPTFPTSQRDVRHPAPHSRRPGLLQRVLEPLTLEIPPARFAGRRYLVTAAGPSGFRRCRSRRSPGAGDAWTGAWDRAAARPRQGALGAGPLPSPSASQPPAKLLGDHIYKPGEFRAKPPSFLNLFTGM